MMHAEQLRVYFVLDPEFIRGDIEDVVAAAVRGGVTALQLRAKTLTAIETLALAQKIQAVLRGTSVLFIVNDRLDLALAVGADGVHLGPHDIPVDVARRLAPNLIIGGSAGNVERARMLETQGASYLGCGALFEARAVKPDASAPQGSELIRNITAELQIPVVGIGGITAANAASVVEAGAAGVAVVREVGQSADPEAAARELAAAVRRGLDSKKPL